MRKNAQAPELDRCERSQSLLREVREVISRRRTSGDCYEDAKWPLVYICQDVPTATIDEGETRKSPRRILAQTSAQRTGDSTPVRCKLVCLGATSGGALAPGGMGLLKNR